MSIVLISDNLHSSDTVNHQTILFCFVIDKIFLCSYRIGPFEVESALLEHPSVAESAAVSSPDSLRGEVVKAFIVRTKEYKDHDPDLLAKEIQDHVKRTTAPYKYPRKVS